MISDDFAKIPRISLAPLYSPIEKLERLSKVISGSPNLYIKRDDFIGQLVWGNKLRKLEYTFANALSSGCDLIITCGGVQSNHARTTAQIARRLGLDCIVVLNGTEPASPAGNFKVLKIMNTGIRFVRDSLGREPEMIRLADEMKTKGKKPYIIPLGASDINGIPGFASAIRELKEQEEDLGITFTHVYHSSSSGGTQAGLEAGKRIFGRNDIKITGISADNSKEMLVAVISGLCNSLFSKLESKLTVRKDDLTVYTEFIGEGYGLPTKGSEKAKQLFLDNEGILLDDTYTAKAADGLISHCAEGRFKPGDNVLFWHTGGLISLL